MGGELWTLRALARSPCELHVETNAALAHDALQHGAQTVMTTEPPWGRPTAASNGKPASGRAAG